MHWYSAHPTSLIEPSSASFCTTVLEGTFSKVKVLVDSPLDVSESYWPRHSSVALDLLSNVSLMEGTVEGLVALLKGKVEDIANVTHVYYFGTFDEEPILHVYAHVLALTMANISQNQP